MCVFVEGKEVPLIVQKSDGGFGYASTDMAAVKQRLNVRPACRPPPFVCLPFASQCCVLPCCRPGAWSQPLTRRAPPAARRRRRQTG